MEFLIVLAQIELFLFSIHSGGATEAMGSANNGDSVNARGRPRGGRGRGAGVSQGSIGAQLFHVYGACVGKSTLAVPEWIIQII